MGLLDGGAAALFGEVMAPLYLAARVRVMATTYTATGDLQRVGTDLACLAQVDRATEAMRALPDAAATDRALYVLAASFAGTLVEGAEIEMLAGAYAGTTWRVADPIDRDPAAAYWLCRGVLGKPS